MSDLFDGLRTHIVKWSDDDGRHEIYAVDVSEVKAEFAQRTCATCQHNVCRTKSSDQLNVESCERNVSIYGGFPSQQRELFWCHEWTAKPDAGTP